jgi:hypothetical protein
MGVPEYGSPSLIPTRRLISSRSTPASDHYV